MGRIRSIGGLDKDSASLGKGRLQRIRPRRRVMHHGRRSAEKMKITVCSGVSPQTAPLSIRIRTSSHTYTSTPQVFINASVTFRIEDRSEERRVGKECRS